MPTIKVKMSELHPDPKFQPRAKLNQEEIENYAELLKDGHSFPPITVIENGESGYSILSGFHRYEAHRINESIEVDVEVSDVDPGEAILLAIESNNKHGIKYTNDDKRRCIKMLLENDSTKDFNDYKIGQLCGVSNHLVKKVRSELSSLPTGNATVTNMDKEKKPSPPTEAAILKENRRLLNLKTEKLGNLLKMLRHSFEVSPEVVPESVVDEIDSFVDWYCDYKEVA